MESVAFLATKSMFVTDDLFSAPGSLVPIFDSDSIVVLRLNTDPIHDYWDSFVG